MTEFKMEFVKPTFDMTTLRRIQDFIKSVERDEKLLKRTKMDK